MKYFQYLPQFEYSNLMATNIMVRAKVREFVLNNAAVYYRYTIEDGQRPDSLATKYYGNSSYTWLLFYANDIYDPLFDWPLSHEAFVQNLINKVGSLEIAKATPHHYLLDDQYVIDRDTYMDLALPANRKKIVTIYEQEQQLNDKRREIRIIDDAYTKQIVNEMRRLFR